MTVTAASFRSSAIGRGAAAGAVAGIAGGLVFGAAMAAVGTLPTVASILRTDSPWVGFTLHMVFAVLIGTGFGLLVAHQHVRAGETVVWGLVYGMFWWFLGPLTLLPLLAGRPVAWDLVDARAVLPSLFGHLLYGGVTAVVFVMVRRDRLRMRPRAATGFRGALAGVAVSAVLYLVLDVMAGATLGWLFLVGTIAGVGYPLLFGAEQERSGPAVIRGTAYGFLCWIAAALTVAPMLRTGTLDWSTGTVTAAVAQLPPYILLGAGTALVFGALGGLRGWLFGDDVRAQRVESPGGRGLRATGYGALAGVVGGLVFTAVMVLVNQLPTVAGLVGARSPVVGLIVHLVIAQLIGVSYAVLFRRRSFDLASGIGWGVSYGFLWWVLGDLTLLPVLTGAPPQWSAAGIAAGFPSLVGHLGYGAALGAVYYRLEARTNPWWFRRSTAEAERVAAQHDQTLGSAPALWALIVMLALTVPVLVSP